jgi:hypothetical protein
LQVSEGVPVHENTLLPVGQAGFPVEHVPSTWPSSLHSPGATSGGNFRGVQVSLQIVELVGSAGLGMQSLTPF